MRQLSVSLEGTSILSDVSLRVEGGSVLAVLGPSGSGKSTLLRAIAGLIRSDGAIELDGRDIASVPTHRRGIGLMFQSHALFPHLSVADNVAFGLVELGWSSTDIDRRVVELLELVELGHAENRSVATLSGGEAQRVALARALAPEPSLLMLDEPLGSLDRRLREELADSLASLLRTVDTTALYVTHDQEEASLVADRMLILEQGAVTATGRPAPLWQSPRSAWIARFLGHPNVSEEAMVPVPAVSLVPDGMPATVGSCRFVDGVWRTEVILDQPVVGLDRLVLHAPSPHAEGSETSVRVDFDQIHRFPS